VAVSLSSVARDELGAVWSSGKALSPVGVRPRRHLPIVALVTASIVVLPAALAALVVPARDLASTLISAGFAVVFSLVFASVEAAAWKRWPGSRDCLFADLTLWGCARRWWTERRLRDVRGSYEAAVEAGAPVHIELLEGLSRLLAARSAFTHGHCRRVARHAERIARAMRLPEAEIARIRTAAVVHDLGKIYIPRKILDKPGPLTDEEFAVVKLHSADGADMLRSVKDPKLAAIVRHHHERLDGSGYPDGLAGEQIPLGARIVAVADTFDALTSHRPYRRAHTQKKGLEILADEAGSQLDREAVAAFLERYSARRSVASLALLSAVFARALAPLGLTSGSIGAAGGSLLQLAPAVGAAGLLALSPGAMRLEIEHGRPAAHERFGRAAPVGLGARARGGSQAIATGRSPVRHRASSRRAHRSPITLPTPARQRARTRGASSPNRAVAVHGRPSSPPPARTSSTPPPTTSSPPPSPPQEPPSPAPPPVTVPPTPVPLPKVPLPKEVPTPPVNLPAKVSTGSLPSVG
jgi:HD-GYP domain-containing protein (c-di-GMP phosphodiesterase class II)